MSDTTASGAKTGPADFGKGQQGRASRWHAEIKLAERETKPWLEDCKKIEARYRDHRKDGDADITRFNILWSNVETLKPAIYTRPPKPVVTRRFRDADPVGRAAATILQRCIVHTIEESDLHERVKQVRDDYLLFARGTLWARYEPHFSTAAVPLDGVGATDDAESEQEEVTGEEVEWDFVHRDDFLCSPARTWAEVRWVARRVRMTREKGVEKFGPKFADVPLSWKPNGITDADEGPEYEIFARAVVYEIWDMDNRGVLWVAKDHADVLLEVDDPLQLDAFFPCPRPLFGTLTNQSLIPIPDYMQYKDQALELDDLSARISKITEAVKVVGVHDARYDILRRMFEEGNDNQLFPVDNYAELAQKGGLKGAFELADIAPLVATLQTLAEVRTQSKNDLYELTGIADIIRGASAPEETATAQRIKGRYATLRLSDRQLEVSRFVRDVLRITAEIICNHFSPQTMLLASNFQESELAVDQQPQPAPQPQMMPGMPPMGQGAPMPGMMQPQQPSLTEQALMLLKDDRLRTFRVEVEDQSTIAVDEEEEKASRTEFLTAVGDFLQKATMLPPALAPIMVPLLGKLLLFGARGFRAGMELETALEDAVAKLTQQAAKPVQPPPPDPKLIVAQAQAKKVDAELQMQQQQAGQDAQLKQQEMALKLQEMDQASRQAQAQNAQDATQHQIAIDKQQLERERFNQEQIDAERKHQVEMARIALDAQKLELDRHALMVQAQKNRDDTEVKHKALEREPADG